MALCQNVSISNSPVVANGVVSLEKVVFMNDSRYADTDMFEDQTKYDAILKQWSDDMPRRFKSYLQRI